MSSARSIVSCFVLLLISPCLFADEFGEKRINLLLGAGLVYSSEYHDVLEENIDLEYGGQGWAALQLGVAWRVTPRWSLLPSVEYLISRGESVFGGNSFTNSVFLKKLGISWSLNSTGKFYVLGEVFSSSADSELPGLMFESNDRGTGLFVGFRTQQVDVKFGVQQIPVDVNSASTGQASRDLGGLAVHMSVML